MHPPCLKRRTVTLMAADGSKVDVERCHHQSCESFSQSVTAETCAACPLRVDSPYRAPERERPIRERDFAQPRIEGDGSLRYPQTGFEPPICPEGYHRKNSDIRHPDAWVLIPDWPFCLDRKMANSVRPCGCIQLNPYCQSSDSGLKGQLVTLQSCLACPVRRLPPGAS